MPTWTISEGGTRYQIDYIPVRKRYRNHIKLRKSFPGANIDSDHNLVIKESILSLKKQKTNKLQGKDGI